MRRLEWKWKKLMEGVSSKILQKHRYPPLTMGTMIIEKLVSMTEKEPEFHYFHNTLMHKE